MYKAQGECLHVTPISGRNYKIPKNQVYDAIKGKCTIREYCYILKTKVQISPFRERERLLKAAGANSFTCSDPDKQGGKFLLYTGVTRITKTLL